mmetsp:Transcript_116082/g.360610  ORF Transcript_116082/g.360610 Transcript_116082/m.360610 type:complete len:351 (-) Transcript_116082:224-1276(-)
MAALQPATVGHNGRGCALCVRHESGGLHCLRLRLRPEPVGPGVVPAGARHQPAASLLVEANLPYPGCGVGLRGTAVTALRRAPSRGIRVDVLCQQPHHCNCHSGGVGQHLFPGPPRLHRDLLGAPGAHGHDRVGPGHKRHLRLHRPVDVLRAHGDDGGAAGLPARVRHHRALHGGHLPRGGAPGLRPGGGRPRPGRGDGARHRPERGRGADLRARGHRVPHQEPRARALPARPLLPPGPGRPRPGLLPPARRLGRRNALLWLRRRQRGALLQPAAGAHRGPPCRPDQLCAPHTSLSYGAWPPYALEGGRREQRLRPRGVLGGAGGQQLRQQPERRGGLRLLRGWGCRGGL